MPGDDHAIRVSKQCLFLAVMSADSFKGSELDIAKAYALSVYYICQVHAMPADRRGASAPIKQGQEFFRQAQAKKPDLVNPKTFSATFDKMRAAPPGH